MLRQSGMEPARNPVGERAIRLSLLALGAVALLAALSPPSARSDVLRVGSWHGVPGDFKTIQDAVDAAHHGDWILIGPGDYHERADYSKAHHAPSDGSGAGVLIQTPDLHIRGMNRNRVIVDGTKPGSQPCSSSPDAQSWGPKGTSGPVGRNGIVVDKANGVEIDNLTACNFLGQGNQIWWNGGDGSGKIGMGSWYGNYLSATTTFYGKRRPKGTYGLFVSNARGPGRFSHSYASNMNDAGVYIGACQQQCHAVVNTSQFEFNALGYSGTNAGGELVLKNSEWDHNATGIVTNSQNNDDAPSPQDGACPHGGTGPTGTYSCEFFKNNLVRKNNNPHTPLDVPAPIGTGIVIAGGRDDTVVRNQVTDNGAWGILLVPFPDLGPPPPVAHCEGGIDEGGGVCFYDDWGNQVYSNTLSNNGYFGNPTNGDLAEDSLAEPSENSNCWYHNLQSGGGAPTMDPPNLESIHGKSQCGTPQTTGGDNGPLSDQVACDTRVLGPCPPTPGATYPQPGHVKLHPLPHEQSMPSPCHGVPHNPWCRHGGG